jgi:2-iminoacetate synthase
MVDVTTASFIDEGTAWEVLSRHAAPTRAEVREILAKARELGGLSPGEVAALSRTADPELVAELFQAARAVKEAIYGPRLVVFAPLYISSHCANECSYCAFRAGNRALERRALTQEEIAAEVGVLVDEGHKRVVLVAGESYPAEGLSYVLRAIDTIYGVKRGRGEIRRVNVNVAPLSVDEFRALRATGIGTYQLFQETYHRETYARVHTAGRKRDYAWRASAMDRAMEAGIDDVGVGALFGLFDWRFELQALLQHVAHLEARFGVGPHTVSVPRIEPAAGSSLAARPPHAVSDDEFRRIVAILRLAVPYTGLIMSTRETPELRRATFALGVSQISAGSCTDPGGYAASAGGRAREGQFQLGDHRSLDEVVRDLAATGYVPSFCTACYRLGRTGRDFMDLAKPGEIKHHCDPNALSTFVEYLLDYGSPAALAEGERLVAARMALMGEGERRTSARLVARVRAGERDVLL